MDKKIILFIFLISFLNVITFATKIKKDNNMEFQGAIIGALNETCDLLQFEFCDTIEYCFDLICEFNKISNAKYVEFVLFDSNKVCNNTFFNVNKINIFNDNKRNIFNEAIIFALDFNTCKRFNAPIICHNYNPCFNTTCNILKQDNYDKAIIVKPINCKF